MYKKIVCGSILFFVIVLSAFNVLASQSREFAPGEIIVKLKSQPVSIAENSNGDVETGFSSLDDLTSKHKINSFKELYPNLNTKEDNTKNKDGHKALKNYGENRTFLMKMSSTENVDNVIQELMSDANVEYAEPNYIVHIDLMPNDPGFANLYGLHNTGQTGGTADADIDAPESWDSQTGGYDVVVAVIDTGVEYAHEDLAQNMWINPNEIPNNGIDDDTNGFIDDEMGWDFRNYDNNPMDDHGHGTHVSGTIGAVG